MKCNWTHLLLTVFAVLAFYSPRANCIESQSPSPSPTPSVQKTERAPIPLKRVPDEVAAWIPEAMKFPVAQSLSIPGVRTAFEITSLEPGVKDAAKAAAPVFQNTSRQIQKKRGDSVKSRRSLLLSTLDWKAEGYEFQLAVAQKVEGLEWKLLAIKK